MIFLFLSRFIFVTRQIMLAEEGRNTATTLLVLPKTDSSTYAKYKV